MLSVAGSIHGSDDESNLKPQKKAPRAKKSKKAGLEPERIPEDLIPSPPRGQKRPSTAAQQGPVIIWDGGKDTTDEEAEVQPPPPKKRATRASLAQQALDNDGGLVKMDGSDNDSVASKASVAPKAGGKPKAKKGRRPSKVRGSSVVRKISKQRQPSDDEIDRALALDLERPLTDEEEGFKDFKKPFIRPMKRLTRSRASLAVEEKMRGAPDGVLVHSARRGRSKTPGGESDSERKGKTPMRGYFRESSQDFSMPVRVPKHLAQEGGEIDARLKSPERMRQEERAESIIRGYSKDRSDLDVPEPKAKKAPAKKAGRGRKKASEATTIAAEEPEASKTKRGRPTKKAARSRSNSVESRVEPSQSLTVGIEPVKHEITEQYEQEEVPEEKPKRSRKGKLVKGSTMKRGSTISIASIALSVADTVQNAPGESMEEPEPESVPEPRQSFMEVDHTEDPTEVSDAGSVIRYDVSSQRPVLAPSPDPVPEVVAEVEMEVEAEAAPEKQKRTKKVSTVKATKKKSTRSSVLSQTTTVSMTTDSGSIINSGDESDVSRHSASSLKKGRKVVKKPSKRQLQQQQQIQQSKLSRNIEDVLRKGSESFFNSSQNEDLKEVKRGRGKKVLSAVDNSIGGSSLGGSFNEKSSVRGSFAENSTARGSSARGSFADKMSAGGSFAEGSSVRGSFAQASSARGSFISESGDVQMIEAAAEQEKRPLSKVKDAEIRLAASGGRIVSFADDNYPRLPATNAEEELSATDVDVDEDEEHIKSPVNVQPSPARIPLSPVRRAVNVPLASTPKSHGKTSTLPSRKPWTAVDLDAVFANLNAGGDEEDEGEVLTAKEKEMTVAEWIKWNAAQAEFRMTNEAERIIGVFEREGRRAIEAVEGIETAD